jgi:hypothetical protein
VKLLWEQYDSRRAPNGAPVSPRGKGICSLYIAFCGGGESGSNLENYIFANRLAAAPPHEPGGLYPYILLLARSPAPAGELLKTPAVVRARQFLCSSRVCLRGYGIYGGFGVLSKTSAPAFRASSAPLNSSIAKCISLFSIVWARTIVHSNSNASDICTVRAQSPFRSLAGKPKSTVESSTCIVSGRSAAW